MRSGLLTAAVALVISANTSPAQSQTPAPSAAAVAAGKNAATIVDLKLVNGKLAATSDTLRVRQGQSVELRWSSDKPMDLHLHGYDIEVKVQPNAPASMAFVAKFPGRFPVSEHGQGGSQRHRALAYVEVLPE